MTITLEAANEALHHSKSITLEAFEALRAAVVAREWDSVMSMCSGSFNAVVCCIWSNAMTAILVAGRKSRERKRGRLIHPMQVRGSSRIRRFRVISRTKCLTDQPTI